MTQEQISPYPSQAELIPEHPESGPQNAELTPLPIVDEIIAHSQDPELKLLATERNSVVTAESIWDSRTLHHATKVYNLDRILEHGHLSAQRETSAGTLGPKYVTTSAGALNFGVPIRELPQDAGFKQRIDNLSYSRHSGADLYLHYERSDSSYRAHEESIDLSSGYPIRLMKDGLPSTEISAISLCGAGSALGATTEEFNTIRDAIVAAEFYIPVFTADGELAKLNSVNKIVQMPADGLKLNTPPLQLA